MTDAAATAAPVRPESAREPILSITRPAQALRRASRPWTARASTSRDGSITALIGPNGAGKTTLFNLVTGLLPARRRSGHLPRRVDLRQVAELDRAPRDGAHVPDHEGPGGDAGDRQHAARRAATSRASTSAAWSVNPFGSRRREKEVEESARELLETFSLETKADDYAGTLSGGQRKLLELARALMTEPRMVLLDEPMAGINPTLGKRLLEHMAAAAHRAGRDLPLRRARHGGRHEPLRRGGRDGPRAG